jgi:uncharacterized membrane protein YjdF
MNTRILISYSYNLIVFAFYVHVHRYIYTCTYSIQAYIWVHICIHVHKYRNTKVYIYPKKVCIQSWLKFKRNHFIQIQHSKSTQNQGMKGNKTILESFMNHCISFNFVLFSDKFAIMISAGNDTEFILTWYLKYFTFSQQIGTCLFSHQIGTCLC